MRDNLRPVGRRYLLCRNGWVPRQLRRRRHTPNSILRLTKGLLPRSCRWSPTSLVPKLLDGLVNDVGGELNLGPKWKRPLVLWCSDQPQCGPMQPAQICVVRVWDRLSPKTITLRDSGGHVPKTSLSQEIPRRVGGIGQKAQTPSVAVDGVPLGYRNPFRKAKTATHGETSNGCNEISVSYICEASPLD